MAMTFREAQQFVMPFGKYIGRTLDRIASENLQYLDWLLGDMEENNPQEGTASHATMKAIEAYCSDPAIQKEIEAL